MPQRLAQAHPTGEVVVQEHGGHELRTFDERAIHQRQVATVHVLQLPAALLVADHEPRPVAIAHRLLQVACIGHHRDGRHHVQRVGRAEEPVQRILLRCERAQQHRLRQLPPHRSGVQFLVGQVDRPVADVLVGVVADLLVAGHAPHHVHFAVAAVALARYATVEAIQHFQFGEVDAVGVVVDEGAGDVGLAPLPVQPLHLVRR